MSDERKRQADEFLAGKLITFEAGNLLWRGLKGSDEIALARQVIERLQKAGKLVDGLPPGVKGKLAAQEAELTSKDPELSAASRHDRAMEILRDHFDQLDSPTFDDGEVLGIAGGIHKRRWRDLGQLDDLVISADFYQRGARGPLGQDAYPHINAAFLDDLLAAHDVEPEARRARATELRERICTQLPSDKTNWWNVATRAEAFLGLGRYSDATAVLKESAEAGTLPAPAELQVTARQLGHLALLHDPAPLANAALRSFFETLLPAAPAAPLSTVIGKVGLALSGGGFRASFYHLGVLAKLAERDVLRHVEVLSCVSGGSIVGACYWLALRRRMLKGNLSKREDYVALVRELIHSFRAGVAAGVREQIQPSKLRIVWSTLTRGAKGAMDPEQVAAAFEQLFYQPAWGSAERSPSNADLPLQMDELPFTPADHRDKPYGAEPFNTTRHNWLRENKVPVLVLNATTVNTGHAWQFTPHWMGESPWATSEAADSVPRLEWSWYEPLSKWRMALSRAVAASACVPFVFEPFELGSEQYENVRVQLLDGGVYDNQGTVSLLAHNCNVVLVSDACGQLKLQEQPRDGVRGLPGYAIRSMDTLMERIRLANFADLQARQRSGLLRGLMFLHMKEGLTAETVRRRDSQTSDEITRTTLAPSGVRRDFQRALAELRTDLDTFSDDEADGLMACGYQMADLSSKRSLRGLPGLMAEEKAEAWPFARMLAVITSHGGDDGSRGQLLDALAAGSKVTT
jgi:predicted acylesterase/phospholipase RssA